MNPKPDPTALCLPPSSSVKTNKGRSSLFARCRCQQNDKGPSFGSHLVASMAARSSVRTSCHSAGGMLQPDELPFCAGPPPSRLNCKLVNQVSDYSVLRRHKFPRLGRRGATQDPIRCISSAAALWCIAIFSMAPQHSTTDFTRMVTQNWNDHLREAVLYKQQYGSFNVVPGKNDKLRRWVVHQRFAVKNGKMSGEKLAALRDVGFTITPHSSEWFSRFLELCFYQQCHGHLSVSAEESPRLFRWTVTQRTRCRRNQLPHARNTMLTRLGFTWSRNKADWMLKYHELGEAIVRDHCGKAALAVEAALTSNPQLYRWVAAQRTRYRLGRLSKDRTLLLEGLGLEWTSTESSWNFWFAKLREFRARNGHCNVRLQNGSAQAKFRETDSSTNRSRDDHDLERRLSIWIFNQRMKFKNGAMRSDREAALRELGFSFGVRHRRSAPLCRNFDDWILALMHYKQTHGSLPSNQGDSYSTEPLEGGDNEVSASSSDEGRRQRKLDIGDRPLLQTTSLHGEAASVLTIPSKRCPLQKKVSEGSERAIRTEVQEMYGNGTSKCDLFIWLSSQRRLQRLGRLLPERRSSFPGREFTGFKLLQGLCSCAQTERARPLHSESLHRLGCHASTHDHLWEQNFRALERFSEHHGHCSVSQSYANDTKLARWVSNQRYAFARGGVLPDRVRRLQAIGFVFDSRGANATVGLRRGRPWSIRMKVQPIGYKRRAKRV